MAEVRIYGWRNNAQQAGAVRTVRDYCGLGLKEAKEIIIKATTGNKALDSDGTTIFTTTNPEIVNVPFVKRTEFMEKMKEKGFLVS